MLFQGFSQRTLSQLDKHSEKRASQRMNNPVIYTLESIFCFVKTNIPELYEPWTSTSSNHSTLIEIKMSQLSDKLIEGFFGKPTK